MGKKKEEPDISRRNFIRNGALGLGTAGLAGLGVEQAEAAAQKVPKWDHVADVVVAGAGASGLCAAVMARDSWEGCSEPLLRRRIRWGICIAWPAPGYCLR